ncbi:hypothetical protein KJ786_00065 [Patescibacteria group bacterium]|nr:hypothetical protein [Patescibacteria group bacterium]
MSWIFSALEFLSKIISRVVGPKMELIVNRTNYLHYKYAEIYNGGEQDIKNMEVKIKYKRPGENETVEKIDRFLNENDEKGVNARPHDCKIIKMGERIIITDFPFRNLEGDVAVILTGQGIKNERKYEKVVSV